MQKNSNYITYVKSGRLGNQLQLYACVRTLSLRYGFNFIYQPISYHEILGLSSIYTVKMKHKIAYLYRFFTMKNAYLNQHNWDKSYNINGIMTDEYLNKENTLFILNWGGIYKDISEFYATILKEIIPAEHFDSRNNRLKRPDKITKNDIGLHLSRDDTDYPLPIRYYVNALDAIKQKNGGHLRVHLYSDGDHESLANELRGSLPDLEFVIHHRTVLEDIFELASYQHIVISMSWFLYWAAYLSWNAEIYVPGDFCYYPHWINVDY